MPLALLKPDYVPLLPSALAERVGKPPVLEFFAGSGLVAYALAPYFDLAWANDICAKKGQVFRANHPDANFLLASITEINGANLPPALLAWASFPCQDLSLAGNGHGIRGQRSGLVWEWLRVIDEMPERPPLLALENVLGLVSIHDGAHYKELHHALLERGYAAGAIVLDAISWLPQSRPRVFVTAVDKRLSLPNDLISDIPTWLQPNVVRRAAKGLDDWIWWRMPQPMPRKQGLSALIDMDAPCHDEKTSQKNISLIPPKHLLYLQQSRLNVVPGYKRTRSGKQCFELRFDDVAGCIRTPAGGSSRQFLLIKQNGQWRTRILSPREAARLMGAPDSFELPGSFNDGYRAMGDAVAAPAAAYLAKHLLSKLAQACYEYA